MRGPGETGRATPDVEEGRSTTAILSIPRPQTQPFTISADRPSRAQLLKLAHAALVEARWHKPSVRLDQATLAVLAETARAEVAAMTARLPVRPHPRPKPHPNLPQVGGKPPVPKTWWIVRDRPGEPPWFLTIPLADAERGPCEGQA